MKVLKLLSDTNRYNIFIKLLEYDELCVSELEELLGIKQSNTSKHLKRFKELKIVESKRDKNIIRYHIKKNFISNHQDLIKYLVK